MRESGRRRFRARTLVPLVIFITSSLLFAQQPTFEVASVRENVALPNTPFGAVATYRLFPNVTILGAQLKEIIEFASVRRLTSPPKTTAAETRAH